jgi:hypothetical protein
MTYSTTFTAALAALFLSASIATAGDVAKSPEAPRVAPQSRVLAFGDGAARFDVTRDPSAGRMFFRLSDPTMKLQGAPVIVTTTPTGSNEVTLTPVEGQPGVWVWSSDSVKADRFDGTMRVTMAGKTYSSPLATVWTSVGTLEGCSKMPVLAKARYGGRFLALPDCGTRVEVVQDPATGRLTIYSSEEVVVTEAPVITITETKGPSVVTLTKLVGTNGAWTTTHETFKTTTTTASIRLLVNGKACEAPLVYGSGRGGQIVSVAGGPSFEVVRDADAGHYTFYAVDETVNGKAYTVENPTIDLDGQSYKLTPVEGEARAWRLVGLDGAGSDARDGQLNITLLGKTLSTRVGLSGFGLDVK